MTPDQTALIWVHVVCNIGYLRTRGADDKSCDWQNIRIYHECEGRIEKYVPRITVWHHEACRLMTNCDPRDRFFNPTLTRIMDYFSCSPVLF